MSITIDTVGACLRWNYVVTGHCGCGRTKQVDLLAIAVARGEALPLATLWDKIRCKCGRRPQLQIAPECGPSGYPLSKG
jgi:hypothetical protein